MAKSSIWLILSGFIIFWVPSARPMANPTATPANENVTVPAVSKNHITPHKLAPSNPYSSR